MGTARLYAVAATVLFSTGGAAIKTAAFSAMQVASIRSGVATAMLLLYFRGRVRWSRPAVAIAVVYAVTLVLFVNEPALFDDAWRRFLAARLREVFPWKEVPIRLRLRERRGAGPRGGRRPASARRERSP